MKIIEWNWQGAFRNKNEQIFSLNPDILIVPECKNEEKLKFGTLIPIPNDFLWYDDWISISDHLPIVVTI